MQARDKKVHQKGKYSPNKKSYRNISDLSKIATNNTKYLNIPHGGSENMKNRSSDLTAGGAAKDR